MQRECTNIGYIYVFVYVCVYVCVPCVSSIGQKRNTGIYKYMDSKYLPFHYRNDEESYFASDKYYFLCLALTTAPRILHLTIITFRQRQMGDCVPECPICYELSLDVDGDPRLSLIRGSGGKDAASVEC